MPLLRLKLEQQVAQKYPEVLSGSATIIILIAPDQATINLTSIDRDLIG
jgi:hypothetical protein